MRWIRDEQFIRGNIPMTKFEVRISSIAALEIEEGDTLIDIGAGTGSISIEAALQGAIVYAVEERHEAVELIKRNSLKFDAFIHVKEGSAPDVLLDMPRFNKCFIGGSKGRLSQIFNWVDASINKGGIIAANFITLKNLNIFTTLLNDKNYIDVEIKLLQVSNADNMGLLKACNPVFIVRGRKH
jgi:cobalt-precorrin-6B (C15)-methyltransferase